MDLPSPWDESEIVASVETPLHPPRLLFVLPPRLPPPFLHLLEEVGLEFDGFLRGEVVAGGDEVGAVGVGEGVEGAEEGEHLCGVAAGAEDDKEAGGGAAADGGWGAGGEGGERGEEADLVRGIVRVAGI